MYKSSLKFITRVDHVGISGRVAYGLRLKEEIIEKDRGTKMEFWWQSSAKESKMVHRGGEGIRFSFVLLWREGLQLLKAGISIL